METTATDTTKSTENKKVITRILSEENRSLFIFTQKQLLEQGFEMIGEIKEEPISNFWDFLGDRKIKYTACFEKKVSESK